VEVKWRQAARLECKFREMGIKLILLTLPHTIFDVIVDYKVQLFFVKSIMFCQHPINLLDN